MQHTFFDNSNVIGEGSKSFSHASEVYFSKLAVPDDFQPSGAILDWKKAHLIEATNHFQFLTMSADFGRPATSAVADLGHQECATVI